MVNKSSDIRHGTVVLPVAIFGLLLAVSQALATIPPERGTSQAGRMPIEVSAVDANAADLVRASGPMLPFRPVDEEALASEQEPIQLAGPVRRAVRRADRRHDRRESRHDRRDDRKERRDDRHDDAKERVEDRRDERKERWR